MMTTPDPWKRAVDDLRAWHTDRRASAARSALVFIESELRLAIPPMVRRTWPVEQVEDALREALARLLERPLPADLDDPRRYVVRAFENRCIDLHRAQQRHLKATEKAAAEWAPNDPSGGAERRMEEHQRAVAFQAALDRLSIADRVALKLVDGPEWLDATELEWLANGQGKSAAEVRSAIAAAEDIHALTEIFDPPSPGDGEDRRLRMERFRRRRGRAREKLRAILDGQEVEP